MIGSVKIDESIINFQTLWLTWMVWKICSELIANGFSMPMVEWIGCGMPSKKRVGTRQLFWRRLKCIELMALLHDPQYIKSIECNEAMQIIRNDHAFIQIYGQNSEFGSEWCGCLLFDFLCWEKKASHRSGGQFYVYWLHINVPFCTIFGLCNLTPFVYTSARKQKSFISSIFINLDLTPGPYSFFWNTKALKKLCYNSINRIVQP